MACKCTWRDHLKKAVEGFFEEQFLAYVNQVEAEAEDEGCNPEFTPKYLVEAVKRDFDEALHDIVRRELVKVLTELVKPLLKEDKFIQQAKISSQQIVDLYLGTLQDLETPPTQ